MEEGYIPITLTPNFDDLIYDAFYLYHEKRPFLVDHNAIAPQFRITHEDPMIVKLHGDYLYDNLKNTAEETSNLEDNIQDVLKKTLNEYGLIVLGYAGEDTSIMDVLDSDEIDIPDYGLFWCTRDKDDLSERAEKVLRKNNTFLIEIDSSKEFFLQLYEELDDLNVPTPVDMKAKAQDRAEQLREGILEVGGADIRVLASEYMRREEYENAINLLTDAIEDEPDSIELLYERARAYLSQENFDRSIGDFSKILDEIDKSNKDYTDTDKIGSRTVGSSVKHEILRNRALARSRAGYYEQAISDFEQLLELSSNPSNAYTELAEAQILSGQLESGIDSANIGLEKASDEGREANALLQILIGKILAEEDYQTEIEEFKKLCEKGFHQTWNFEEIDKYLDENDLSNKEQDIEGIKRLYYGSKDSDNVTRVLTKEDIQLEERFTD